MSGVNVTLEWLERGRIAVARVRVPTGAAGYKSLTLLPGYRTPCARRCRRRSTSTGVSPNDLRDDHDGRRVMTMTTKRMRWRPGMREREPDLDDAGTLGHVEAQACKAWDVVGFDVMMAADGGCSLWLPNGGRCVARGHSKAVVVLAALEGAP